ncbi:ATP-dependent DNA helicase RecG [Candidatus Methanophagaceae archaeon]|nr:ATP-dependent DNA helicase RecG [Methanophagales archaeon]
MTGYIEQWGTGTNEMVKRCLEWGLSEPEFEYVIGDLVVTFMKTKLTEEYLDKIGLNERQKKAIKYLKENKEITLSKFRIISPEISDRTLRKDLEDIVKVGLVKPVGEKRGRKYVLK